MFQFPFTQPQQYMNAWQQMMNGYVSRMETINSQLGEIEEGNLKRAEQSIDEAAKLMKASIAYTVELSTEWRKQAFDAGKQVADMAVGV